MGHTARIVLPTATSQDNNSPPEIGSRLIVEDEQFHHLKNVLRCSLGISVEVLFPQSGLSFTTKVEEISANYIALRIIAATEQPTQPLIHLLVGKIRPKAAEDLVRWCCELGVTSISFFRAEFSQLSYSPQILTRLTKIALSAAQQAKTPTLCAISQHSSLDHALNTLPSTTAAPARIFLSSPDKPGNQQVPNIAAFLQETGDFSQKPLEISSSPLEQSPKSVEIYIVIGPEGGFSDKECALLREFSFNPCSLGPNILRTQTAALLGCAFCHSLLSDLAG